jgi:hypothetical protein
VFASPIWLGEKSSVRTRVIERSGDPENDFTNRNTTFMMWNLMHLARLLREPAASRPTATSALWDAGCRVDFPNPEHR